MAREFGLFGPVYLLLFVLAFISHFIGTDASLRFSSSSGSGYGSGSYGKSKSSSYGELRDNDVEPVKRDSIHRHLMFAANRIAYVYILPVIEVIWSGVFSPIFEVTWKGCSYVNDFMCRYIYDAVYPVLAASLENIHSIVQVLSNAFSQFYTKVLKPIWTYFVAGVTDYIYSPALNLLPMIWDNIIGICSSVFDACSSFFKCWYDGVIIIITWLANGVYDYVLQPCGTLFVKLWSYCIQPILNPISNFIRHIRDNLVWIIASSFDFCSTCFWRVCDIICDVCRHVLDGFISTISSTIDSAIKLYDKLQIMDAIKYIAQYMYYALKQFGTLCVKIWNYIVDVLDYAWQPLKMFVSHYIMTPIIKFVSDSVMEPMTKLFAKFIEYTIKLFQTIGNMLFENLLAPLGSAISTIGEYWKHMGDIVCRIFDKLQTFLLYVLRQIFKVIWSILCFVAKLFAIVWDTTHRYFIEMNVTKLKIAKDDKNLNNYEIGVYYATKNKQRLYVQSKQMTDDYVYLWLRNTADSKRANAKIMVRNINANNSSIYQQMVRLNKQQSHAIPMNKNVFENVEKECREIQIEFVLEDVSQTTKDQTNRREIVNQNNHGNTEGMNIGIGGNGATYIAVDNKTRCQYQFELCYQ